MAIQRSDDAYGVYHFLWYRDKLSIALGRSLQTRGSFLLQYVGEFVA